MVKILEPYDTITRESKLQSLSVAEPVARIRERFVQALKHQLLHGPILDVFTRLYGFVITIDNLQNVRQIPGSEIHIACLLCHIWNWADATKDVCNIGRSYMLGCVHS